MSNRSLIEFNHDYWDRIRDDPDRLIAFLLRYLNSGSVDETTRDALSDYGVRVFGMRHHSTPWEDYISKKALGKPE